ncbi:NUT family member 1 [Choloepus didactylus]|uniref:NUT family member 1 n=1 Tax=Choloepus didactylus TaxID=27675 RepID=UPI0018A08DF5|nr:NUT family member 1 [Choloepus didactylus]
MASNGASSMPGPDMTMKPGSTMSPFTALPFRPPSPGPPEQPPWEPPLQPPMPSAFSPGSPLVLSAFPSPLLVTGDGGPGPSGAGTGKVIVKVKTEGGPIEPSQSQNFILTQTALNWIAPGAPCGGSEGPPTRFMTSSNVKTILPAKASGVSQEGPSGLPLQTPPPAVQLAPSVPPEKVWPGPHGAPMEESPAAARSKPSLGDLSYTSKGVYENFRRWQRYKALARRHLSESPETEALSCFLIPVLRSLARLKPTMTLEEGLPRAVQEWEHTSNFDRMIFYEMAEKFMEFEAEEEIQIRNVQLINGSQCLSPAASLKLDPPGPPAPEVCQQPVYIPKKAASKSRAPRRRQRKPQRPPVPEAPKEIPPEAVKEYADIMEGLVESNLATGESDGKQEEEEEQQQEEEGMYPDPGLLSYIDGLCSQEVFVSKVEAIIHPRFLADLLSPEKQRDPLALIEELEQEEGLTLTQLVQKRLLALEEEDAEAPPSCSGAQSDSSPSVSDEEEDGGGRLRSFPGPPMTGVTIHLGKAASPGKRAREGHGGQERALDGPRGMRQDANTLPSSSSWDLQLEVAAPWGIWGPLGTERRGSGKFTNQTSPHQIGHLGGVGSPGHSLVANRTTEALALCWQEGPQLQGARCLAVGLAKPAPFQGQRLEKQVLGLQTGQQMGSLGLLPQGKDPLAMPQEGSSGAMWSDDTGPPMVQSYDQNPSPGVAVDRDGASLSPGFWLSSEMDAVGLELPLQIKEVIENFQHGECVTEHQGGCQALGSRSHISLCPGETTPPRDVGSSAIPCGGTDAPEKRNYCSLPGPLRAKENGGQSPETGRDSSDQWAGDCSPLLESRISAPTLESPKETLLPPCQSNVLILGPQDAPSFPEASQEAGNRGNSISSLLETTEHVNISAVRDDHCQLGTNEDTCPPNFNSYDPQGEGREETEIFMPKDLAPLPGSQDSYTCGPPKSTSHQGLESTSPRWGPRDALIVRETSPVSETRSSADGASKEKKEEGEEEDKELSNFVYLLASKLSLSPRGLPLIPRPASKLSLSPRGLPLIPRPTLGLSSTGDGGAERASPSLSNEAEGLGLPPRPVAKCRKRVLVGGSAPIEKKPHPGADLGVSGEKSLALGAVRTPQRRKRRRDSFATGRRKKRRRNQ